MLSVDLCSYLNLKLVFRFSCCSWFLPKPAEEPHFSQRRRRYSHWMQTQDVSSRHDLLAQRQRRPPRKQQVTPLSHSDAISHIYGSFPSISGFLPNATKPELFQKHQQDYGMMSPQYCACAPDLVFDIMSLSNHFCYSQQHSTATDFGHSSLAVESHYSREKACLSMSLLRVATICL